MTRRTKKAVPDATEPGAQRATGAPRRRARCKVYHGASKRTDQGTQRGVGDRKSRCPGWADNGELRQRLLEGALVDPEAGETWAGHPKRLWNAVGGWYFVGVSTNEADAAYNCYPEVPTTLLDELAVRAERTIEDLLVRGEGG